MASRQITITPSSFICVNLLRSPARFPPSSRSEIKKKIVFFGFSIYLVQYFIDFSISVPPPRVNPKSKSIGSSHFSLKSTILVSKATTLVFIALILARIQLIIDEYITDSPIEPLWSISKITVYLLAAVVALLSKK